MIREKFDYEHTSFYTLVLQITDISSSLTGFYVIQVYYAQIQLFIQESNFHNKLLAKHHTKLTTNLPSKLPTKLPSKLPTKLPTKLHSKLPNKSPLNVPQYFPPNYPPNSPLYSP